MSLKAFHVFFIAISLLMCGALGTWGVRGYLSSHETSPLYISGLAFVAGIVLCVYGLWFLKKLRNVSYI